MAMDALGASVTPMAFAELYTALQMGVVDGQENPINTTWANKFYEVQKHVTLTGHMTQQNVLVTNDKWFRSLSPELQDIINTASLEAGDLESKWQIADNKQNLEDLKAKGMIVNTVNLDEFREKTKDAWLQFEPQFGRALYEKVKAAQN
jgi:TRAP-type transport system periplasmic protein